MSVKIIHADSREALRDMPRNDLFCRLDSGICPTMAWPAKRNQII
jgi:hypothetical protein